MRNPCQRLIRTENPGESSVATWLSGITPLSETRKVHLWICVDETTKFTVGHVWAEGQQVGNIDGSRVLELLRDRRISVLRRMHTLRTDPEEAPWQASVTENTIGIVKDTMTRIALERPDLESTEVLAA